MNRFWMPIVGIAIAALGTACVGDDELDAQEQNVANSTGPQIAPGGPTEVWAATNSWTDTDTEAARAEGLAWTADSGLNWEQKYDAWVSSLETTKIGYKTTFMISTPYGGRSFIAPTLDCGEVAYTLRAAFSSWYHLPFFVKGWDSEAGKFMYAGHFGVVYADGSKAQNFPNFKNAYADYEPQWVTGTEWPMDLKLRSRHLGDDDAVEFLENPDGSQAGAGAYFDEIFLNKRTGHFLRLLLLFYGSVDLAEDSNLYHITPESLSAGDVLLYRRARQGTGHTMPVFRVDTLPNGRLAPQLASGNIPRRTPSWEEPMSARNRFFSNQGGGLGENSKGEAYVELGGGIRRWRTAVYRSGRWYNDVIEADKDIVILASDHDALSARPDQFRDILITGSPEEQRDVLVAEVESAREHLREYPASCSARRNREAAFVKLTELEAQHFNKTAEQVDRERRTAEDYVFGELLYEQSKTCCWNSTTSAMYEIIWDYYLAEKSIADTEGVCREPSVFRAREGGDGYEQYRAHAEAMGRGAEWVAWSADEECPQAGVVEDTELELAAINYCEWSAAPTE